MSMSRTVIGILLSGEELCLKEIAEKVTEASGAKPRIQGVSNLMTRLSDKAQCDLGHFIRKNKIRGMFAYKMIHEALALSGDQAYGLYLKSGKEKYTLREAVEAYPALNRFVNPDDLKRSVPKAEPVEPEPVEPKPVEPEPVEPKPVEPKPVEPEPVEPKPVKSKPVKPKPVKPKKVQTAESSITESSALDSVYEIIRNSRDGVDIATLAKKTQLDDDSVWRIVLRLSAQDKIVRAGKGIFKIC